jgi:hypothetical protein
MLRDRVRIRAKKLGLRSAAGSDEIDVSMTSEGQSAALRGESRRDGFLEALARPSNGYRGFPFEQ